MNQDEIMNELYMLLNESALPIATLAVTGSNQIGVELQAGEKYLISVQPTEQPL